MEAFNKTFATKDQRQKQLHRSTLRGVKKCKRCGQYNGYRAQRCKNKLCILAIGKVKKKITSLDTVQLISMTDTKLYSVQVREKDVDNRNFVQITDKTISADADGCIISRNAICFVDTCKYDSHDVHISCKHVKNALENQVSATVLIINISVWYSMNMNEDAKSRIWKLYSNFEHTIPIVQRINKTAFAVKCDTNAWCPAGRLHIQLSGASGSILGPKYTCGCKQQKPITISNGNASMDRDKCEHLYLLVAAILSNDILKEEFKEHVQLFSDMIIENEYLLEESLLVTEDFIKFSENILNDVDLSNDNFNSNFIDPNDPSDFEPVIPAISGSNAAVQSMDVEPKDIVNDLKNLEFINCKIEFMDELKLTGDLICVDQQLPILSDKILTDNRLSVTTNQTSVSDPSNVLQSTIKNKKPKTSTDGEHPLDVCAIGGMQNIPFILWLNSVIERINLTMDYNDCGSPEPLTFSIHHGFFEKLRNRFSIGMKLRLPNQTKVIKDGKYKGLIMFTWHFTTVAIVQKIFTTKNMSIEIEKVFAEHGNGVYRHVEKIPQNTINDNNNKSERRIRLPEYKTFLRIGPINRIGASLSDNESFTIDWIPSVLKKSNFGEMRITLKFGHMKNNTVIR